MKQPRTLVVANLGELVSLSEQMGRNLSSTSGSPPHTSHQEASSYHLPPHTHQSPILFSYPRQRHKSRPIRPIRHSQTDSPNLYGFQIPRFHLALASSRDISAGLGRGRSSGGCCCLVIVVASAGECRDAMCARRDDDEDGGGGE